MHGLHYLRLDVVNLNIDLQLKIMFTSDLFVNLEMKHEF